MQRCLLWTDKDYALILKIVCLLSGFLLFVGKDVLL